MKTKKKEDTVRKGTSPKQGKTAPVRQPDPETVSHMGTLRLSDVTRLTLLHLDAEVRVADGEIVIHATSLNAFIKSIDPEGRIVKMQTELQALVQRRDQMKNRYKDTVKEAGIQLGVTMSDYSFDEGTGILHQAPHLAASTTP